MLSIGFQTTGPKSVIHYHTCDCYTSVQTNGRNARGGRREGSGGPRAGALTLEEAEVAFERGPKGDRGDGWGGGHGRCPRRRRQVREWWSVG
jgi:hypothetical protein